jgi:HEAT repeat protein
LALRHNDSGVRRGAAAALRALGAWQAVPALEAALAVENEWQAHAAIAAAIQYLDRDIHIETMVKNRDVRGLCKMLNSTKAEDLIVACDALGEIGDRQAVEPLVMVFRNPMLSNKVRLAAADALLKLESAPAVVTLLGALRRSDNWQVRRNAAAVLGQLGASWTTDALIKALEDENQFVQRTAAAALRRFGTPEAIQAAVSFEAAQRKIASQESAQVESKRPTGPISEPKIQVSTPTPAPKSNTGPLTAAIKKATGPLSNSALMPAPVSPASTETAPEVKPAPPAVNSPIPESKPAPTGVTPPTPTERSAPATTSATPGSTTPPPAPVETPVSAAPTLPAPAPQPAASEPPQTPAPTANTPNPDPKAPLLSEETKPRKPAAFPDSANTESPNPSPAQPVRADLPPIVPSGTNGHRDERPPQ